MNLRMACEHVGRNVNGWSEYLIRCELDEGHEGPHRRTIEWPNHIAVTQGMREACVWFNQSLSERHKGHGS